MLVKPLIFGILGVALSNPELELLKQNRVYGFILFQRNIQDREQLTKLISTLKELYTEYTPKIFIDQEGGRVARLKPPIVAKTYLPAAHFGKVYDEQGEKAACEDVYKNYSQLMTALKELGIDSPCAPVADLYYDSADKVIGDRSFGSNVDKVVALCVEATRAINDQGGIAIIKHIPGHGRATIDSHFQLPRVDSSCAELNESDFKVFKQLSNKVGKDSWAMSAHILFTDIDNEFPATLSSTVINFIRKEIGFQGILVSDAIEMGALHETIGAQHQLVTRALSVDDSDTKSKERFDQLVNQCIEQKIITGPDDVEELMKQSFKIKSDFTSSIVKVTKQALEAGCDLILHCNGDIEEMTALCGSVPENFDSLQ